MFMLNKKAMYVAPLTVSVNKNQNYAAFNTPLNNPASHQAALIVHVSIKVFCLHGLGMQSLVSAVCSAGAKNVVLLGGLAWSNSLAQWTEYLPVDPLNNTAATWHSYNLNYCNNQNCWDSVAQVKQKFPIVCTELEKMTVPEATCQA